jgi:hypothetical protein
MSATIVPTVTLRADGTYAVPITPGLTLVWGLRMEGDRPVMTVKAEREGCKVYHSVIADEISLPVKQ